MYKWVYHKYGTLTYMYSVYACIDAYQ